MKCFQELGLEVGATPDEVKASWRALASKHHPDRGGDAAEFSRLRKFYNEALAIASAPKECAKCLGLGKVKKQKGWVAVEVTCPTCNGTGEQS
jgi:DnaJ-class molecular chaperone